ncbi:MAG: YlbF family regulator [Gorillibacterium sp.]|nr:YlbF family regulator [Gorillibacterium sp.]
MTSFLDETFLEPEGMDMAIIYEQAYELGDSINSSVEAADYLYWRNRMDTDLEVSELIQRFLRKKDLFEESMRFGHFHPNYHQAMQEAEQARQVMEQNDVIRNYKKAENELDELLLVVAETIARSVSESIKVSGNEAASDCSSGGCSSGGSCSGGCG